MSDSDSSTRSPGDASVWRHRWSLCTLGASLVLIVAGAFVTSIDAGLAVPDWPTSFGSLDPLRPFPEWWTVTPVLAEHGHRLLGALVGLLTLVLAGWTWRADERTWVRYLAAGALVLVVAQGILGGLRVVWVSLDLAVVHACTAQLFLAVLVVLTVVTSPSWTRRSPPPDPSGPAESDERLLGLSALVTALLYLQIVLGALLRHPGGGLDTVLLVIHVLGAVVAAGGILVLGRAIRRTAETPPVRRHRSVLYGLLTLQFALGIGSYLLLRRDAVATAVASPGQIVLSTAHLAVGALLFATTVSVTLWVARRPLLEHVQADSAGNGSTASARTQPA